MNNQYIIPSRRPHGVVENSSDFADYRNVYGDHRGDDMSLGNLRQGLMNLLQVGLKWWWLFLILTSLVMAAAYVLTNRITPVYQADAKMEIKQSAANVIDVSAVEQIVVNSEFMETQILLLQSESLARTVVESLNLFSDPTYSSQALPLEERINQASARLAGRLGVTQQGRSRIITLTIEDTNPARASNILNELMDNFITYNLQKSLETNSAARETVRERLAATKQILEQSERELAEYARNNEILDLNGGTSSDGSSNSSLSGSALFTLNDRLSEARSETYRLQERYTQLRDNPQLVTSDTLSQLRARRDALNEQIETLGQTVKPDYPEMVELRNNLRSIESQIAREIDLVTNAARSDFQQAQRVQYQLSSRISEVEGTIRDERTNFIDYNILVREVETNRSQYEGLLQRLKDLTISEGIAPNLVTIVDRAGVPKRPVRPNMLQSLIFAFVLGMILASLIVLIKELIDDRVKSPEDVNNKLNTPLLGVLPVVKSSAETLTQLFNPTSILAESFSSIRTNLLPALAKPGRNSLHVTSTRSGEGKSLMAFGLAKSFSDLGKSVILIDADMRKPAFLSNGSEGPGLAELMVRSGRASDFAEQTRVPNLQLLPVKERPSNPAMLLSSPRFIEIVEQAKEDYDIVIVDSPPVLGLADAPTIGGIADHTVFVVECSGVRTPVVEASLARLRSGRTNIVGLVLNKYRSGSNKYLDYYYYSYGEDAGRYGQSSAKKPLSVKRFKKRREKLKI